MNKSVYCNNLGKVCLIVFSILLFVSIASSTSSTLAISGPCNPLLCFGPSETNNNSATSSVQITTPLSQDPGTIASLPQDPRTVSISNFSTFGGNDTNLVSAADFRNDTLLVRFAGGPGDNPGGLVTQKDLGIEAKKLIITAHDIKRSQSARDFQVALSLEILNSNMTKNNLVFVNGPLSLTGWINGTYYGKVYPNTTREFPLAPDIQAAEGSAKVNRIYLVLQRNSTLDDAGFSVKFLN